MTFAYDIILNTDDDCTFCIGNSKEKCTYKVITIPVMKSFALQKQAFVKFLKSLHIKSIKGKDKTFFTLGINSLIANIPLMKENDFAWSFGGISFKCRRIHNKNIINENGVITENIDNTY